MLTRNTVALFALALTAAGTAAAMSGTAAAAPCQNGGTCTISGGWHSGGGGGGAGGGTGGGGGAGGGTGPGLGCPTVGAQIVCAPGQAAPAAPAHVPTIDVAETARTQIPFPVPHVHTAPAGRTYVQLTTGLWVDPGDYATLVSPPATITGETVTATATPRSVTWNMGEGTVVCTGPGSRDGTGCGYTYTHSSADRPGGTYTISATITWALTWACQGACDANAGVLAPETRTTTAQLAVGEIQTESNRN